MTRAIVLLVILGGAAWAAADCDLGPFLFIETDNEGKRTIELLGPVWESSASVPSGTRFLALRPLYARMKIMDGTEEASVTDTLWPIGTAARKDNARRWRFFPLFGYNRDVTDPESAQYVWLLPLVFWGKDQEGVPYFAVFPLGGTIRGILARDSITFVLFPLYIQTGGRGRKTWDVLFPIFSVTRGERVHKFRMFPLYGQAVWDGESKSVFVLWPFFTWKKSLDEAHPGRGYMIFPLYGALDTPEEKRRLYLWPFFRYRRVDRGKEVDFPWPFLRYSSIPQRERLHVWPLWGYTKTEAEEKYFFLWPIFRHVRRSGKETETTRTWAFPITWRFLKTIEGETEEDYRRVWPLISSWEHEGVERVRLLDLWPLKNTRGVEWNWAPWWTVASSYREGDDYRVKFLWGLVRSRKKGAERRDFSFFPLWQYHRKGEGPETRTSWSLLKGLFGVSQKETETETRLLYFFRFRKENRSGATAGADIAERKQKHLYGGSGDGT